MASFLAMTSTKNAEKIDGFHFSRFSGFLGSFLVINWHFSEIGGKMDNERQKNVKNEKSEQSIFTFTSPPLQGRFSLVGGTPTKLKRNLAISGDSFVL